MNPTLRILILEDVQDDVILIEHTLKKDGIPFEMMQVDSQETFINALHDFDPDVILSDHSLPQFKFNGSSEDLPETGTGYSLYSCYRHDVGRICRSLS